MTLTQASDGPVPQDAARARRRLRPVVVFETLVLVSLLAAGGLYWRWRNDANDLYSANGVGMTGPLNVGGVIYANSDIQPKTASSSGHRRIALHRVAPRLSINTAHATVTVLLCRVANPNLGVGVGDTTPCAAVHEFRPGIVDLGFPATEIIYKITASRAGTLHISGADVSYSAAGRKGTQHAGNGILVTVSNSHI